MSIINYNCDAITSVYNTLATKDILLKSVKEAYENRLVFFRQDVTFHSDNFGVKKDEFMLIEKVFIEEYNSKKVLFKLKCSIIYNYEKRIVTFAQKNNDGEFLPEMIDDLMHKFETCLLISERFD